MAATSHPQSDVRLLCEGFCPNGGIAEFAGACPEAGELSSFLGQVRNDDDVEALDLAHYEPMTLPAMFDLAASALSRWDLQAALIWHRVGVMLPGEPIVLVAAAARHRREAFAAVDFIMDHLKSDSWFWKRERRQGVWQWIEARQSDHDDLARWQA